MHSILLNIFFVYGTFRSNNLTYEKIAIFFDIDKIVNIKKEKKLFNFM